jgi:hypothetical protein
MQTLQSCTNTLQYNQGKISVVLVVVVVVFLWVLLLQFCAVSKSLFWHLRHYTCGTTIAENKNNIWLMFCWKYHVVTVSHCCCSSSYWQMQPFIDVDI